MPIILGILALIALIIFVILMLPVQFILKTDENGEIIFRFKFLNKIYGEESNPDSNILKTLKKVSGISRLESKNIKKDIKKNSFSKTVKYNLDLITDVFKIVIKLLKQCTVKTFKLNIVCAEGDAAETALSYGKCCAITYPALAFLHSLVKFEDNSTDINISCDYEAQEGSFNFDILLSVRVGRLIAALFKAVYEEAQRDIKESTEK